MASVHPRSRVVRLTGYGTSEVLVELLPYVAILGSGMEGARA